MIKIKQTRVFNIVRKITIVAFARCELDGQEVAIVVKKLRAKIANTERNEG